MIVAAIIVLAGVVIVALINVLSGLPILDMSLLTTIFELVFPFLQRGMQFLNTFVYVNVVQALLLITVAVEAIVLDYKLVMWVATKIPMFGVSD